MKAINLNNIDYTKCDVYYCLTHNITSIVSKGKKPPARKNSNYKKVENI